jgi:purine nucleosidase
MAPPTPPEPPAAGAVISFLLIAAPIVLLYNTCRTRFQKRGGGADGGKTAMRVVFDCDNTFGIEGKDVDDALALLYLLGRGDVQLAGVTTTFGNGTIDEVYESTRRLLADLGRTDIPLLRGAPSADRRDTDAARFLAEAARRWRGEVSILATGSCANLLGAQSRDPGFFSSLREIVVMGGIVEPLLIGGKKLDELNFSVDPGAALAVLTSGKAGVVTANLCLQAPLARDTLEDFLRRHPGSFLYRNRETLFRWYDANRDEFGTDHIYPWDAVAAQFLTDRGLFTWSRVGIDATGESLASGLFFPRGGETGPSAQAGGGRGTVLLPVGIDGVLQTARLLEAWSRAV